MATKRPRTGRAAVRRAKKAVDDASTAVETARDESVDDSDSRRNLERVQTDLEVGKEAVDRADRRTRRRR